MKSEKEKILDNFNKYVLNDSAKARAIIEGIDYENDPYWLRCIALTYKDEALFFKNGKMRKVFLTDKLKSAKKYIKKAFKLNPNCRDVLYTKGVIYNALGDIYTAIDCYISILELGEKTDKISNCSNSELPFIQMILNDAKFQLYRLFYDLEDFEMSNKFLESYKENLNKGVNTIYSPLENFIMTPNHL